MHLILQIGGVVFLLISFGCSIYAITNNTSKTLAILLLVVGASLIKIGRAIYKNSKRK